jgi:hypothetical protein
VEPSGWGPGGRRFKSCLPDSKHLQMALFAESYMTLARSKSTPRGPMSAIGRETVLGAVASIPGDRAHPVHSRASAHVQSRSNSSKQQPIRTPADACSSPDRVWADAASFETLARRPLQASAATVPGRPHPEAEVEVRQRHRPAASITRLRAGCLLARVWLDGESADAKGSTPMRLEETIEAQRWGRGSRASPTP